MPLGTLIFLLLPLLNSSLAFGEGPAEVQKVLEDFESLPVGSVPTSGWNARGGSPSGIYKIAQETGTSRFLEARDTGRSVQLFRKGGWHIKDYPYLSWKWRVKAFPKGADERNRKTNDSAVAVYVVFPKRFFIPETIKYVWSRTVPSDTKIAHDDRFPLIVVRSGEVPSNEWVLETRNVKEDYEKHFKRSAPDPVAIGFLTDANGVKGIAEGAYDDVTILRSTGQKEDPEKNRPSNTPVP